MMGVEAPETCWATHKRQVINLWNCCIKWVNLFEQYIPICVSVRNGMCVKNHYFTTDCCIGVHVPFMYFRKTEASKDSTIIHGFLFLLWRCDPTRVMASSFLRFLGHTQRQTTVGRTPLDEWSARRWDLYLTTHNTHNRQTSMPSVGFEPTISAGERPQTYALDRAATGTGIHGYYTMYYPTNALRDTTFTT